MRDIFRHKTCPHAFSWLTWAVLSGIAFGIQVTRNGGPGAWLMGVTSLVTFFIFVLCIFYGEKRITKLDWLCLASAGLALLLWVLSDRPLLSVLLIAFVDAVGGFLPTFRKSFTKPYEETEILYILYALSLGLSLVALRAFTLVNAFYPATFIVINLAMASYLHLHKQFVIR